MFDHIHSRTALGVIAGLALASTGALATQVWPVDASESHDSTFVPTDPCRLFDTRANPAFNIGARATPLGTAEEHVVQATGDEGECSLPSTATAVAINLTGVNPTQPTYVAIYPSDIANPGTSALNMVPGQPPTPNKVDVKLSSDGELTLFNRFGTIDVIGDVLGFYSDTSLTETAERLASLEAVDAGSRLSALEAADPFVGGVVMEQGMGWVPNAGEQPSVEVYEDGVWVVGSVTGGTAHLPLTGPVSINGVHHRLESVTYCVQPIMDGFVTEASLVGLAGADGTQVEVEDTADRTEAGCYTVTATSEVADRSTHHLMVVAVDTIRLTQVTATWVPDPDVGA